jgi:DoxX-like protein
MNTLVETPRRLVPRVRAGQVLSGIVVLFLLLDAGMKLARMPPAVETTVALGYPAQAVVPLGVVLLAITLHYAWPRTAVLGAILLTGYLGGAVATHVRVGSPIFTHMLFGIYVGLVMWGGLYLREERLRALLPLRG